MVIADLTIFPVGAGEGLALEVAKVVKVIKGSGLKHLVGSMGTSVEGEWDEIMTLITQCRASLRGTHRVYYVIKIDERDDPEHSMEHKISAVSR
ncbi:MAG: hypothetical protein A2365_02500 [Candidatus Nealsonbacteria bacterium RIFOXYB1_FULL_40_15]|uniref:Thiamine-binding protein domain-containing protein n=2 Tax=Candidatus Nealsoniibacteriota TaxID=1817911 RepID=A0A1G2ERW4_9BACT|nr:MAG: hypothetical protein A2365_02500 [Candidatus Nealsonbacteria bacterium RIFOXYB1_FULL_40_15]OGZ28509.1 MAG: hypothetical protein A2427_02155 [Candidatus Nealsonbacteria bacterium RIFOXYC1_FULL_40_7]OGZ28701.1 MAG: hypothetical protein A2562_00630 [Candidatus Nealsonbacteria bacterium RIFOXYD1_FULL_39_11]